MRADAVAGLVRERDQAQDEGGREQGVEGEVEDVPEAEVVAADLPAFGGFVAEEAEGHEVEDALDEVEVAAAVDGVDGPRVEREEEQGEEDLHAVLIARRAQAVRVDVRRVRSRRLVRPRHEPARVPVVLHQPAAPQVRDAFLVPAAADHAQAVQVHRPLYRVRRLRLRPVHHDRVPLQQQRFEQVRLVLLLLDDLLRQHFARRRPHVVQVRVPQL